MVELYGSPFYPLMGMGEDMTFCFRARQAGFKLYCDSRVKIGHIGQKIYDEDSYILQKLALEQYEKAKRSVKHERT
jgi:GT2 family glycosyltransferase